MAYPGTPAGQLFSRDQRMPNGMQQFMSPRFPAFAAPPGFAPAQAIPQLEASFAFITDQIHYQSGEEEVSAERVTLEANLQQESREREILLREELVELCFARYMSQQAQEALSVRYFRGL